MDFVSHASSSKGNLYEIYDGKSRLIIECGIAPRKILSQLCAPIGEYAGVLISHEHMDHARAAAYLVTLGLPVRMTEGTFAALEDVPNLPNLQAIQADEPISLGSYDILPKRTHHDAAEPVGFLIRSRADGQSLLFATDTGYLHHTFAGISILAIECNYAEHLLAASDKLPAKTAERIRRNHLSFERLRDHLDRCDLSATREIWLLHLSDAHSHATQFRQLIAKRYGVDVYIA